MSVTVGPPPLEQGTTPPARHRRRCWPWITGAALLAIVATVAALFMFGGSTAKQVPLDQAQARLPSNPATGPLGKRPPPGVYQYLGSGTDRLTLPPESQPEGPSMPGTITLRGQDCWTFRIDYSTHHWQAWDFCWRGGELRQTGGRVWQLWPLGPMSLTNSTTVSCTPEIPVIPESPTAGQTWTAHCSATSSAVKGTMEATAVYRYVGRTALMVNGVSVRAEHLSITQTDQGSQKGTESYQMWLQVGTGLLLRFDHDVRVDTDTPVGASTYTQKGTFSLASLAVHQG